MSIGGRHSGDGEGTEPEPSLGKTAEHPDNRIGRKGRDERTSIDFSNALHTQSI